MDIDGYEFSISEILRSNIGKIQVQHYFIVDHSDRLEKYLNNNGFLLNEHSDNDFMHIVEKFKESYLFYHLGLDITIDDMKKNMGIDYLCSNSDNLQNHYPPRQKYQVQSGQDEGAINNE